MLRVTGSSWSTKLSDAEQKGRDATAQVKDVEDRIARLRNDKRDLNLCLQILLKHGWALRWAPPVFRGERLCVLAAVSNFGRALEFASPAIRGDVDVAKKACDQDGQALAFVKAQLRSDKILVMKAVSSAGRSLEFASKELRDNDEIVLAAVTQDAAAMQSASDRLKEDKDFAIDAVRQQRNSLRYFHPDVKADRDVIQAAFGNAGKLRALGYTSYRSSGAASVSPPRPLKSTKSARGPAKSTSAFSRTIGDGLNVSSARLRGSSREQLGRTS